MFPSSGVFPSLTLRKWQNCHQSYKYRQHNSLCVYCSMIEMTGTHQPMKWLCVQQKEEQKFLGDIMFQQAATQPWHVPRGEAEAAAWEACNIYLPVIETFFLSLSSLQLNACLEETEWFAVLLYKHTSVPVNITGARWSCFPATGLGLNLLNKLWSKAPRRQCCMPCGRKQLELGRGRNEGWDTFIKNSSWILFGCQQAQGGCCKCLNSHAEHIQIRCPSNDPNQDRQTVKHFKSATTFHHVWR